jgi:hypothetical protein
MEQAVVKLISLLRNNEAEENFIGKDCAGFL